MPRPRRRFKRRAPVLRYRKLFLIATEGAKTEPSYFSVFNNSQTIIRVKILPAKKHDSSPSRVLKRARQYIKRSKLRKGDEVWLVIDLDQWTEKQLKAVYHECMDSGYHLAVSNPQFEYWLLLHFEDGKGVAGSRDCMQRLLRHLPNFKKTHLEMNKIIPGIPDAIRRARTKDPKPHAGWPRRNGSTVYRLVQKLRNETETESTR